MIYDGDIFRNKKTAYFLLSVTQSLSDGDDIFKLEQQAIASVTVIPLLSTIEYLAIVSNAILRSICINQDFKKRLHGTHYTRGTAGEHKAHPNTEMKQAGKICMSQMCSCIQNSKRSEKKTEVL